MRKLAVGVTLIVLVRAASALAAEPADGERGISEAAVPGTGARLALEDCDGLDVGRVRYLLRLELAVMAARADRPVEPQVVIQCSETAVEITVSTGEGADRVRRRLDAPPQDSLDRERVLAIAASQALMGSWLFLVVEGKAPDSEPPLDAGTPENGEDTNGTQGANGLQDQLDESAPAAPAAEPGLRYPAPAAPAAEPGLRYPGSQTGQPPNESAKQAEELERGLAAFTSLEAGLTLRDWTAAYPLARAALQAGVQPRNWIVGLGVGWQGGQASRTQGAVRVDAVGFELEASWRAAESGSVGWWWGARAGASFVRAEGRSALVPTDRAEGFGFDGSVHAFPRWPLGDFYWDLPLQLGVTLPQLDALVREEEPVRVGGLWAAASLRLGYVWGGSR